MAYFHPLYFSALVAVGLVFFVLAFALLRTPPTAQVNRVIVRVIIPALNMVFGLLFVLAALYSIWQPECGTVLDLPPCPR